MEFDVIGALWLRGLEPLLTSLLLPLLSPLDLRRCGRVSRNWRRAVEALWARQDAAERSAVRRRWRDGTPARARLLQCRRDRAVCTVSDVAMDDDVLAFALASSGRVELWDRATSERRWDVAAHDGGVYAVDVGLAHEVDGSSVAVVATGGDDAAVRLWRADSGELLFESPDAHELIVWSVRLTLGKLVSFGYDCVAIVWALSNGGRDAEVLQRVTGPLSWSDGLAVDSGASLLASTDENDFCIKIWSLRDVLETFLARSLCAKEEPDWTLVGHQDEVNCVRFCLGGRLVASGSSDSTVRLWTIKSNNKNGSLCLRVLRGFGGGKIWSVSASRRRVAASGRRGEVGVWHVDDVLEAADGRDADGACGYTRLRLPSVGEGATAVGQVRLDGGAATLLAADGMGRVVVAEFAGTTCQDGKNLT